MLILILIADQPRLKGNFAPLTCRLQRVRKSRVCNDAPILTSFAPLVEALRSEGAKQSDDFPKEVAEAEKVPATAAAAMETLQADVRRAASASPVDTALLQKVQAARDEKRRELADEGEMAADLLLGGHPAFVMSLAGRLGRARGWREWPGAPIPHLANPSLLLTRSIAAAGPEPMFAFCLQNCFKT